MILSVQGGKVGLSQTDKSRRFSATAISRKEEFITPAGITFNPPFDPAIGRQSPAGVGIDEVGLVVGMVDRLIGKGVVNLFPFICTHGGKSPEDVMNKMVLKSL